MADTAIAISAGTGTNVDTRTEATNGNHRQVIVIGDPSTNAGVAPVDATTGLAVNVTNSSLTVASHAVTNAGTFATQAAQSGTWTVQPGNTANTTAWKVDGSAVTQPISSTALTNINTALGSTALDLGVGTGGSRTLRVAVDTSQTDGSEYETVAASATNQVMGAVGGAGDYLSHVIVSPGTAACGVVTILDNATTIAAFPGGGTTALSNLIPFIIPIGITSTSGAWKITTGANVTCTAVGNFT